MKSIDTLIQLNYLAPVGPTETAEEGRCPFCGGSGIVPNEKGEAAPCVCFLQQMRRRRIAKANLAPMLLEKTFANFDLRYYPGYRKAANGTSYEKLASDSREKGLRFVAAMVEGKTQAKGLFFTGPVGSGKTHLAAACANELMERCIDVLFLVVPDFLDDIRASYGTQGEGSEAAMIRRAKSATVLVLDDLGAHNFSQWTQDKLFSLVNYRLNQQMPIVVTSNLTLNQLEEVVGQRTTSRLVEACTVCRLEVEQDIRLIKNFEG